jgi:pimeloyl-ACP methyl ester carboxylesterase
MGYSRVDTRSGRIANRESGKGPVALFVHGVIVNSYLWRHQLAALSVLRRCIAVDLMAHGGTEIARDQEVTFEAQATMLAEFLDALGIETVDLVANDSGTGIAQIFAVNHPDRLRTLTLTNGDVHDNWPPKDFSSFLQMVADGGLPETVRAMVQDKDLFRGPDGLAGAYENPRAVSDETIDTYLQPFLSDDNRMRDLERFIMAFDNTQTVGIEERLKQLTVPTLVVWGTGDVFFGVEWSRWLADTIPGTRQRLEIKGARLFLPDERARELNDALEAFWSDAK